ncbi:hypothetical protein [Marinobacter sp.]|uniref:hypothetical protein n=1 Tax=Marinobacter sp. TaxID=50741 RepID=UPI0038509FD6
MVTAPIVGASREKHLDDALTALQVELTREEKTFWGRRTGHMRFQVRSVVASYPSCHLI